MKVLLVDDDIYTVEGLKKTISWNRLGIDEVITAQDGVEAWEKYVEHKPNLLITDVYMPIMNGLELIQRIREVDANLPVVILSGYGEFNDAKEAIHLNVSQYILKPTVFTEIESVLATILNEMDIADKKEQYFYGLQSQLEQSVPILREQFLYDMLTTGIIEEKMNDRIQFLGLPRFITDGGLVMSLKIYRIYGKKMDSERDWQLYKFAVHNIAQELITQMGNGFVLRYTEDRFPLLLFGSKAEARQKAKQIAEKLVDNIGNYLELEVNVGIGRWSDQFTGLPSSFTESKDMLAMIDYEGFQNIFDAEEAEEQHREKWPIYPLKEIRQLSESLLRVDRDSVMEQWAEIEQMMLKDKGVPQKYIKTYCISIVNSIVLYMLAEDPALLEVNQLAQFLQMIESAPTGQLLTKCIRQILNEMLERLEQKYNASKQHYYINHVKKVVADRFFDSISFAQIADELFLTRNYLSSLFKRETGTSFSNYLTLYRIERAKEFIRMQRYMLYEITEMVGYSDPAYFSRVFKNVTGINPTDYALGRTIRNGDQKDSCESVE